MIESFVEGRVRLRSPLFAENDISEALVACLAKVAGICRVDVNSRTCGVLLEYDPSRISKALILEAAPLFERMGRLENLSRQERRAGAELLLGELKSLLSRF